MAESKLGIYQLGYAHRASLGKPFSETAFSKFTGITDLKSGINMAMTVVGAAGGIKAAFSSGNSGQTTTVNGVSYPPEMMLLMAQMVQAQQQGGTKAVEQVVSQNNNNAVLERLLERLDNNNSNNNRNNNDDKKDNTALYVGLGVGGLLLVTMMFMVINKK